MDYPKSFDGKNLSLPQFQGYILFIPSKGMSLSYCQFKNLKLWNSKLQKGNKPN